MKVAMVSSKNIRGEYEANLINHEVWLEKALKENAKLVCFPEGSLTGYYAGDKVAVTMESSVVKKAVDMARKKGVWMAFGLIERDGQNFYNTQVLAGPGGIVGYYRKINLVMGDEQKYLTRGKEIGVFNVDGIEIAMLICADTSFAETVRIAGFKGAEAILAPHATYLDSNPQTWVDWRFRRWQVYALDSALYMLGCNNAGLFTERRQGEEDYRYASGALAMDYTGCCMHKNCGPGNKETILFCDLDITGLREYRRNESRKAITYFTDFPKEIFYNPTIL